MSVVACPGCIAQPMPEERGAAALPDATQALDFSLPDIHCAACIATVERGLLNLPQVAAARVNLSKRRVRVRAVEGDTVADLIVSELSRLGFRALPLNDAAANNEAGDPVARDLLMRLAVAGFAAMNVMLLSVSVWSGAAEATRDFLHWVSAVIAIPAIGFSAVPFFRNALTSLRAFRLDMDVPISLAILLATGMSLFETFASGEHAYFDAALSLTFFLLLGRVLDHTTRGKARSAAAELAALEVPRAVKVLENGQKTVALAEIAAGDVVAVAPGMRMPVDGVVAEGQTEIDRSLLTGETAPVAAAEGTPVWAGDINLTGPVTVTASSNGRDTSLSRLSEIVSMAEASRSQYTGLAEKAARIYAPLVHVISAVAFVWWLWASGGDVRHSLNIAIAVLIITCPCALGLAVPAVMTAASGRLFQAGILLKDATALERLAEADIAAFDKTGTLTDGQPVLLEDGGWSTDDLARAASLAAGSAHPLARALVAAAEARGLPLRDVADQHELPGRGIEGRLDGLTARLGRSEWLGAAPADGPATMFQIGTLAPVCFRFADNLRKGAKATINQLGQRGIAALMLTGDNENSARHVARAVDITDYRAGLLPNEKADYVTGFAAAGQHLLMVGDGLNDTAALAGAHVSMAPATALDAARTASDFVLIGDDLSNVVVAVDVARRAKRRILENFGIAAAYNMIAVPLACAGFATPLLAALAMSTSSILVSLNAMRVKG